MSEQWRRMLPPRKPANRPTSKTLQPLIFVDPEELREDVNESSLISPAASMPDLNKLGKRPKLFQRASQYIVTAASGKKPAPDYFASVQEPKEFYCVDVEQIITSIFEVLARNPYKSLSVQHNGHLLRVLEAYKILKTERDELVAKHADAVKHNNITLDTLEGERRRWKEDETHYKADIKRLEVLIAKGKTGLSQVTLARQQSLVRGKDETRSAVRRTRERDVDNISLASRISTSASPSFIPPTPIRHTSPSRGMSILSASLKGHPSYLNFDFIPGTPPLRSEDTSLTRVDVPRLWRRRSETTSTTAPSSSPAKSFCTDISSTGGDPLPDETEQQEINRQALDRVAKMIVEAKGASVETAVRFLEQCIARDASIGVFDDITPMQQRRQSIVRSDQSSDEMPAIHVRKSLARRRGEKTPHLNTENLPFNPRRPFSFYAGDDMSSMKEIHSAPIQLPYTRPNFSKSTRSSPLPPLNRKGSLIPSPVGEHTLAKPRREDSSSSVITSLQRSPIGESGDIGSDGSGTGTSRVGSAGRLTPRTPTAAESMRSAITTVRRDSSSHRIVEELEMKRKNDNSSESLDSTKTSKKKGHEGKRKDTLSSEK